MVSKAWNWDIVSDPRWQEPSEDVYYFLNRWQKDPSFKHFLDLGCGRGRHAILFAQHGFNVTALDLSESAIEQLNQYAKVKNLAMTTLVGDMLDFPFKPNQFDCLIAYHVLSHTDTLGIKAIFKTIRTILKQQGEFFVTLCAQDSPRFVHNQSPWIDENTFVKDEDTHEKGIPHFYANLMLLKTLLRDFDVLFIKQTKNIDSIHFTPYTSHYFIHARVK